MLNVAETSAVVFLFICYLHPKKSFQAKPKNLKVCFFVGMGLAPTVTNEQSRPIRHSERSVNGVEESQ